MRHLYYCDGMITNWTTHWNDGAAFATGLERTGPVEIEATRRVSACRQLLERALEVRSQDAIRQRRPVDLSHRKARTSRSRGATAGVYAEYDQLR